VLDQNGKILGKNYFRNTEVNKGFYSKKREGVADVDPKVTNSLKTKSRSRSWSPSFPSQESPLGRL
jgi:hypothetical protein